MLCVLIYFAVEDCVNIAFSKLDQPSYVNLWVLVGLTLYLILVASSLQPVSFVSNNRLNKHLYFFLYFSVIFFCISVPNLVLWTTMSQFWPNFDVTDQTNSVLFSLLYIAQGPAVYCSGSSCILLSVQLNTYVRQ